MSLDAGGVEVTRAAAAVHSSHPHYLTRGAAAVPPRTGDPPPFAASGCQYLADCNNLSQTMAILLKGPRGPWPPLTFKNMRIHLGCRKGIYQTE